MIYLIIDANRNGTLLSVIFTGVRVIASEYYSLKPELLARHNVQIGDVLVLNDIGVRYDTTRRFIADNKLAVYRADTIEALEDCLFKVKAQQDATKYLADLNEG